MPSANLFSPSCQHPLEALKALKHILLVFIIAFAIQVVLTVISLVIFNFLHLEDRQVWQVWEQIVQWSIFINLPLVLYGLWRLCRLPRFYTVAINISAGINCVLGATCIGLLFKSFTESLSVEFQNSYGYVVSGGTLLMLISFFLLSLRSRKIIPSILFGLSVLSFILPFVIRHCGYATQLYHISNISDVIFDIAKFIGVIFLYLFVRKECIIRVLEKCEYSRPELSNGFLGISLLQQVKKGFRRLFEASILTIVIFMITGICMFLVQRYEIEKIPAIWSDTFYISLFIISLISWGLSLIAWYNISKGPENIIPVDAILGIFVFIGLIVLCTILLAMYKLPFDNMTICVVLFLIGCFGFYIGIVSLYCSMRILRFLKSNRFPAFCIWFVSLIIVNVLVACVFVLQSNSSHSYGDPLWLLNVSRLLLIAIPVLVALNTTHLYGLVYHELNLFLKQQNQERVGNP